MEVYLHQGYYWGDSDKDYKSTEVYKIFIKQVGETIMIKKQEDNVKPAPSKREYKNLNEFFKNWGMVFRDCNNIKL